MITNMQHRRRFRKGSSGFHSTLPLLRKDLRGGNLQSLFGGSSFTVAPSNAAPDPLLSSFILNFPVADSSKDVKPESLDDGNLINKTSEEKAGERYEALAYPLNYVLFFLTVFIIPISFPKIAWGLAVILQHFTEFHVIT